MSLLGSSLEKAGPSIEHMDKIDCASNPAKLPSVQQLKRLDVLRVSLLMQCPGSASRSLRICAHPAAHNFHSQLTLLEDH